MYSVWGEAGYVLSMEEAGYVLSMGEAGYVISMEGRRVCPQYGGKQGMS